MDKRNTSGYRGVRLEYGKWTATIYVDGRCVRLGRFNSKEDAAQAYNVGAIKYFGECARLNIIKPAEEMKL